VRHEACVDRAVVKGHGLDGAHRNSPGVLGGFQRS
jgi:hypothetical protein